MKTKGILFTGLLLILGAQNGFCRKDVHPDVSPEGKTQGALSRFIYNEKVALKVDYFGELVLHPGLCLGVDYTLIRKNLVIVHWDSEFGGYWHKWNNSALFLKTSIGTRFPIKSMFVDLNLGAGYMHSFVAGTIYQKSSDGGLERAANRGHSHFMPGTSLLFGWAGNKKKQHPWSFHIGAEIYLQSSFNHIFLPHAAAKVGFTYKFKEQ